MSKLNVSSIITDHFATFKNFKTGKRKIGDYFVFLILPFVISIFFICFNILLTKELSNILITALSIFAALLFNLLLLTYDIINKNSHVNFTDTTLKQKKQLKHKFLKEIYANISFSILISIISVILLLGNYFLPCGLIYLLFNFFSYFFIILFLLTLFLILKRIHILLSKEFIWEIA